MILKIILQILVFGIFAQSAGMPVNSKISASVNAILSLPSLPLLYASYSTNESPSAPLSSDTLAVFSKLQKAVFGARKNTFTLQSYNSSVAFINIQERIIYLNPKLEKALKSLVPLQEWESVMALILAHEMGHYFYEVSIQRSPSALSPLGQLSYVNSGNLSDDDMALIHGEVDLIGMYLAWRAGFNSALGLKTISYVDRALRQITLNIIGLSAKEIQGRTQMIRKFSNYTMEANSSMDSESLRNR